MPARCCARSARARTGACDRYANAGGALTRVDPLLLAARAVDENGQFVPFAAQCAGTATLRERAEVFVTGVGSGTTYPDYKPAPFIVSRGSIAASTWSPW